MIVSRSIEQKYGKDTLSKNDISPYFENNYNHLKYHLFSKDSLYIVMMRIFFFSFHYDFDSYITSITINFFELINRNITLDQLHFFWL